jgi:hypothetical protein
VGWIIGLRQFYNGASLFPRRQSRGRGLNYSAISNRRCVLYRRRPPPSRCGLYSRAERSRRPGLYSPPRARTKGRLSAQKARFVFLVFCESKMQPREPGLTPPPGAQRQAPSPRGPGGFPERPPEPRDEVEGVGARIGAAFASAKDVTTAATLGAAGPWSARRRSRRDGLGTAGRPPGPRGRGGAKSKT